jgi:hypothetical protein
VRVRGYAWLLAVLCLAAANAACTGDSDKPSTLPSTGASVTTPGSPLPSSAADERAATELVNNFWRAADSAAHGGQIESLKTYYTSACSTCASLYRDISTLRAKKQRVAAADHVVSVVGAHTTNNITTVSATISARPGQLLSDSGAVLRNYAGVPPHDWIFEVVGAKGALLIRSANNLGPS